MFIQSVLADPGSGASSWCTALLCMRKPGEVQSLPRFTNRDLNSLIPIGLLYLGNHPVLYKDVAVVSGKD